VSALWNGLTTFVRAMCSIIGHLRVAEARAEL
jgi:hypothetical protein